MDQYLTTYRRDYLWPHLSELLSAECEYVDAMSKLSGDELALYQACMHHAQPSDCRYPQRSDFEVSMSLPEKEGKLTSTEHEADESDDGPWAQPLRMIKFKPPTKIAQADGGGSQPKAKCDTSSVDEPLDKTEYQDSISKLGGVIMHNDHDHRR